jgi:hypothetical protein
MVRAVIFASVLMIGGVAMAQDAPPADAPAAEAAAPADTTPAASTPAAADTAAAPAAGDASYPPCSAKVQDHCIQGAHKSRSHRSTRHAHHK